MKEIKVNIYMTAEEVSNRLNIQKSTVRKYAGMLDTVDTKQPFFHKDDNGTRLYSEEDIAWLEQLIRIKNTPGTKLEDAVQTVYGLRYNGAMIVDTENSNSVALLQDVMSLMQRYSEHQLEIIKRQSENIDRLETLVEKLLLDKIETEQNKFKLSDLAEEKQVAPKQGFFKNLFSPK